MKLVVFPNKIISTFYSTHNPSPVLSHHTGESNAGDVELDITGSEGDGEFVSYGCSYGN